MTGIRPRPWTTYKMTRANLRLAAASTSPTKVGDLCAELGISRHTLYRHVSAVGELHPDGQELLSANDYPQPDVIRRKLGLSA